jgi:hypothetical protein
MVFFRTFGDDLWHPFDPAMKRFDQDRDNGTVLGVTDKNRIVTLDSNLENTTNIARIPAEHETVNVGIRGPRGAVLTAVYAPRQNEAENAEARSIVMQIGLRSVKEYQLYIIEGTKVVDRVVMPVTRL